jgi:hypothetical protein
MDPDMSSGPCRERAQRRVGQYDQVQDRGGRLRVTAVATSARLQHARAKVAYASSASARRAEAQSVPYPWAPRGDLDAEHDLWALPG